MTACGLLEGFDAGLALFGMLDLGLQILKLLAVAGGAAVGGFGCGRLVRFLAQTLFRRRVPPRVVTAVKLLGAVALGWAVWLWVYGPGGSGWGVGGGLGGLGSGREKATGTPPASPSLVQQEEPIETNRKEPPAPERESAVGGESVRVEMLGGARVSGQRFYRLEGESEARTIADLRQALEERRRRPHKTVVKGIEIVIYENSVSKDHPAVKDLEKWARENDLTPTLSFPTRDLP